MKKRKLAIIEVRLRKIIYDELVEAYLVQEDPWDDVKFRAQKLSAFVTGGLAV